MNTAAKHYADRDAMALDKAGGYYTRHVCAMTAEQLHAKSDIAAELGWRDMQIDQLRGENDVLKQVVDDWLQNTGAARSLLPTKYLGQHLGEAMVEHIKDQQAQIVDDNNTILALREQLAARVPDGLIALLQKRASDSYSCSLLAKDALAMLAAAPQPVAQPEQRCEYCDGTGDVHGIDGQWRGSCNCGAAHPEQPAVQGDPVMDVAATWWSLVMGAAAAIEDASNCLRDEDAKRSAIGSAKHYRERANALYTRPQPERVAPVTTKSGTYVQHLPSDDTEGGAT